MRNRFCLRPFFLAVLLPSLFLILNSCGGGGGGSSILPTKPPVPAAPMSVVAYSGNGSVMLRWSAVLYAKTYNVLRSDTSGTGYVLQASGLPDSLYTDTTVTNNQTYYYVVQSVGSSGVSGNSAEASATPSSSITGATISGTAVYEDKEYDYFGFTGNILLKAIRYATVELVSSATESVLDSQMTTSAGTFSFNVAAYQGSSVYARVLADAFPPSSGELAVKTDGANPAIYAVAGTPVQVSTPMAVTQNFQVAVNDPATGDPLGGAFNILDVYTGNDEFLIQGMGEVSVPTLTVYWPSQSANTYYCNPQEYDTTYCDHHEGIYVLSDPPAANGAPYDTDEYDDDVIRHEFGHFVAYHFSKDDSPGGTHAFWVNDYDLRLTWSEGWADFFEASVKEWLAANEPWLLSTASGMPPAQYVDTATVPHWFYLSLNQGDPESYMTAQDGVTTTDYCNPGECLYSSNEIAVSNVLWNVMNGYGPIGGFGMQAIWTAMTDPLFAASTPANMEAFYDTLTSANTSSTPDIQTILHSRSIDYVMDSYEPDDSLGSAGTYTPGLPQEHTLYSDGSATHPDRDYVGFDVNKGGVYTIATPTLRNGADPYIEIYDPLGNLIASNASAANANSTSNFNCDPDGECHVNGVSTFAASVTLSSAQTTSWGQGKYHVLVEPYAPLPPYVGRYGSYTLEITGP